MVDNGAATSVVVAAVAPPDNGGFAARVLRRGDKVHISLRGIPVPESIEYVVDGSGSVSLPLVQPIVVAGLTPAEAGRAIERAYVDGGIYKKITIVLVALGDDYFIRGEVKKPDRYPLTPDLTLLRAIATAGGYTDFAKRTQVRVIRGDDVMVFNAEKVERRRDPDPSIERGDIIVVGRRIFLP